MKIKSTIIALLMLTACGTDETDTQSNQQTLRQYGGGQPVEVEFQAEYSTYVWEDDPVIYVPNFGTTFDLTSATQYSVASTELDNLAEISVEFWFDPDLTGPFNNYTSTVLSFNDTDFCATGDNGFYFHWHDQALEFRVGSCYPGNGGQFVFSDTDLVSESNHVVILTYSNKFEVYLNGVLKQTVTMTYSPPSNTALLIGAFRGQGGQYIGGLDNFAVYSRTLTSDEIIRHYAVGSDLLKR